MIKVLEVSADPYMRGRMRDASITSYSVGFGQLCSRAGIDIWVACFPPRRGVSHRHNRPLFWLTSYFRINGYGLGVVVRSESADAKAGDHVYGTLRRWNCTPNDLNPDEGRAAYQHYFIRPSLTAYLGLRVIENKEKLPWSLYTGVLGMPGKKYPDILPFLSSHPCYRQDCIHGLEGVLSR